eukprot:TRINITY_DN2267_c0_g1_i2.p1 TRINITY_DN2267_c0_g1~~TRINITY_DN2267_c0_g1_i2.p1  ORF type:complete len:267 (+),score=1.87 TRINITY_DN2267_c0_g1_i2:438-1238(+)
MAYFAFVYRIIIIHCVMNASSGLSQVKNQVCFNQRRNIRSDRGFSQKQQHQYLYTVHCQTYENFGATQPTESSTKDTQFWMNTLIPKNKTTILLWGIIFVGYLLGGVIFLNLQKVGAVLFVCGCALGIFWEVPLSFPGCQSDPKQLLRIFNPKHIFMLLPYLFWDGFIFMLGYWGANFLLPGPCFVKFDWQEFLVYFVWGQVSSLAVEVFAAAFGLWSYKVSKWNPALFRISSKSSGTITFLPQAIWMVASTTFYFLTLYITKLFS